MWHLCCTKWLWASFFSEDFSSTLSKSFHRISISIHSSIAFFFYFFWLNSPQWARASSITRFLDHTQQRTTFGRTPLDERSACHRDLDLAIHNNHKTDIHAPGGILTHHLSRRAAVDLRLGPRGHWDGPSIAIATKLTESLNNTIKYPWERENCGYDLYAFKYFRAQGRIQALWSLKLIKF